MTAPIVPTEPPAEAASAGPASARDLTQALLNVQGLLLTASDVESFLTELALLAAATIDPAASCGITTRYDGKPISVASSDGRAALLDETQYAGGEGPCLHAMTSGQPIYVPDVASEARWPLFMSYARTQGLRCSYSLPLVVQGASVGAMNFYAFHKASAFDIAQQTAAAVFAAQAAGAIQLVVHRVRDAALVAQLEQALTSRSVIDQAMGIVMAQDRCSADAAFASLRARSQSSQRKLRDVAADLVAGMTTRPIGEGGA